MVFNRSRVIILVSPLNGSMAHFKLFAVSKNTHLHSIWVWLGILNVAQETHASMNTSTVATLLILCLTHRKQYHDSDFQASPCTNSFILDDMGVKSCGSGTESVLLPQRVAAKEELDTRATLQIPSQTLSQHLFIGSHSRVNKEASPVKGYDDFWFRGCHGPMPVGNHIQTGHKKLIMQKTQIDYRLERA